MVDHRAQMARKRDLHIIGVRLGYRTTWNLYLSADASFEGGVNSELLSQMSMSMPDLFLAQILSFLLLLPLTQLVSPIVHS